jgi:hypothetical protein
MRQLWILLGLAVLTPWQATAQTKISNSCQTSLVKAPTQHWMRIDDSANHMIGISQVEDATCSRPWEIEGLIFPKGVNTAFLDMVGSTIRIRRGYSVSTAVSGEKVYARYWGTMTVEGHSESGDGTWSFYGGTGKVKGIKGKGTWKCKTVGENLSCDAEGEYELPKSNLFDSVSGLPTTRPGSR